jgi:hypothetical protein
VNDFDDGSDFCHDYHCDYDSVIFDIGLCLSSDYDFDGVYIAEK